MMKKYENPVIEITELKNNDVITASGLIFGGEKGKSEKESFGSLFGN